MGIYTGILFRSKEGTLVKVMAWQRIFTTSQKGPRSLPHNMPPEISVAEYYCIYMSFWWGYFGGYYQEG
jgi:hypothetical protein